MKKNIIAALILIAFLVGLAGIILLCAYEVDGRITCIFAGGLIFLTGLIITFIIGLDLRTAPILIMLMIGALTAGIPARSLLAEKYPDRFPQLTDAQIMNKAAGGIMALAGSCVVIFPLLSALHKKRCCTERVTAECVDIIISKVKLKTKTSHFRSPVWEFYFDGETYRAEESSFSDHDGVEVGDTQEILVNPKDPKEVYRRLKHSVKSVIIFGSFFVIIGLWLCFL